MKKSLTLLSFLTLLFVAATAQAQVRTGTGDFFNITRTVEQTADSVTFVTDTLSVYDTGGGVANFIDQDSVVIMFVQNRFKIVNNMLTNNRFDYVKARVVTSSPGMSLARQTYNNVVTTVGVTGAAYGTDPTTSGREIGMRPVYRLVGNIATSSPFNSEATALRQMLTFRVLNPTANGDGVQIRNIYFKPNINNLTGLAVPPDTTKDTLRAYHVIGNVANIANAGDVVSYTDLAIVRLLPGTTQVLMWVKDSAQAIDAGEYIGSFGDYSRGRYFLGDDGLPMQFTRTMQFRPSAIRTFDDDDIMTPPVINVNPDEGIMIDGFPPERNPLKFTNIYQTLAPYWYNSLFGARVASVNPVDVALYPVTELSKRLGIACYPNFPGDPFWPPYGPNPNPENGLIPPYRVGPYAVAHNPYQPGLVTSGVDTLRFFDNWGNRTWDRMTAPRLTAVAYTIWNPRGEDRTVYLKGYQAADDTLRQFGQIVYRRLTYVHADVGANAGAVEDSVRIVANASVNFIGQGGWQQSLEASPDTSGGFPRNWLYSVRADEALLDNSTRILEQWQVDDLRGAVDSLGVNSLPYSGVKIVVRPNIPRAIDIEARDAWKGTADRNYLRLDIVMTDGWGNTVDDNEKFKFEQSDFGHLTYLNPPGRIPYRVNGLFDTLITTVPQVITGPPGSANDSGRVNVTMANMGRATRVFRVATGSHNAGAYRIRVRSTYAFNDRFTDLSDPLKLDPNPGPGFSHLFIIPDGSPNNNFGVWFGPNQPPDNVENIPNIDSKLGKPMNQTTAMDSTDVYWDGNEWHLFPVNPRVEVVSGTGDALIVGSVGSFACPGKPRPIYDRLYIRITDIYSNPLDITPYFNAADRQQNRVWVELPDNPPFVDAFNSGLTNKVFFGSVSPNIAWRGDGSPIPYDCPTNPAGFEPSVPEGHPNAGQTLQAELVTVPAGQGLPGIQGDVPTLKDYGAVRFYLRAPKNVSKLSLAGTDVIRLRAHLIINTNIPNVGDFSVSSGFAEVSVVPDVVQTVEVFKSWGKPSGTTTPMEGWSPISESDARAAWYPTGTPRNAAEGAEFYKGYFFRTVGAVPPTIGQTFPTPAEPGTRGIGGFLASDVSLDGDCTAPIPLDTVMVSEHNQQMRIVARLLDQFNNPVGGRLVKFFVESETLPITLPKTQLQTNVQRGGFGEFGKVFIADDTLKRTTIGDTATAGWVTAYYVSGRVAHQIVRIALTPDTLAFDLCANGRNLGEGTAVGESRRGYAPRVIIPLYLTSGPTIRVQIYPYTAAATSPIPLPVDLVEMQALQHNSTFVDTWQGGSYTGPTFTAYSANPFFVEKRGTHLGRMANSNIRPYIPDTLNLTQGLLPDGTIDRNNLSAVTAGRTVTLLAREYDRFGNLVELQIKPPYDQNEYDRIVDTARIKFRMWGDNWGNVPSPYNAIGGTIAPSRDWTRDEYGPMRKARYRHTQISNLVAGVHINQTTFLTALEYPTPKTSDATVFVEAWADAWPDPTRPGPTEILRDTIKVLSITKDPTRFDVLRAGQEYLQSEAGRWLYVNEPESRTINIMAPQINLPPGADALNHDLTAVSVDNILISQAYKRNVSEATVGKYLVVNDDNVPLDREGDPLYLDINAQEINPDFERDPYSNLPRFQKLDVYNNISPLTSPSNRYNVLNDDMLVKLGYTIPGARQDVPQTLFDLTIAGGGSIYDLNPLNTGFGTIPYQGIGWHVVNNTGVNQRPVLLRATPVWENEPPTGGNPFIVANQPGQTRQYGRLYADSIYTYSPPFGGAKDNSIRAELMGSFTDRGRGGSYAPQTNGEFDRVTRIGAGGWRAEDFTIAGLNAMSRTRNAAGVWGGITATGGLWAGDWNRRVILVNNAFGHSGGERPIVPGAFIRLVDSTAEQVLDLRIIDPTRQDKAGNAVEGNCSYDQGKFTVVRKHQRLAGGLWHIDDTYWRGGDGIEDGILGPNATSQFVADEKKTDYGIPANSGASAPQAAAVRSFFGGNQGSRKLRHTFVVVPYRIAFLSLFPSSYDPGQGMFDNTRLPLGILPVQADIDTIPRVNLGIYPDGMHDASNWEMYTRLYGQIRHGATDQIPNNANTPYARPDTIFRDFRYVYNVTPYDRYGNQNTRDTMFVQVGARLSDWTFTNLEPSGTLIVRSGGNFFGAIPINTPMGPDNINFRQDTIRLFNPLPQTNMRNDYLGIKPDDKRLTLAVGDPGGPKIPHGLLPANVVSSRPVWIKQAFAPAPFVLSTVLAGNSTLFRMDHTGGCVDNGLEKDILRLQWGESRWTGMPGKNNPNDTVKYEWYGIIDSVGTSSTGPLVVSRLSDNNGIDPTLTITGQELRQLIFRPTVQPQPNQDSLVMRVKWFVRAFNKAGLSTYSDTAGATIRNNPLPTPALIVSINRPPENPPAASQPVDNATISGLGPTSPPIDVIWTASRDRNIDKGNLIGGFKVYNVGSQTWIDDPSGRTIDTLEYQWIGVVVRTFPVGKGAPVGTMLVKNTGTTTGFQLGASDLDALFAGFDTDPTSTSADSVIVDWMVYVKDASWTDTSPIENITFRYNPDGSMVADTSLWSRFGCRPHTLASRWFRLNLTKLDVGGVEIDPMAADPDIDKTVGEEVEFVLTAKDKNGNIIRDWNIKGVPVTLTITGSTANTDSSSQSWSSDPLAYSWAVITHGGQNLTQAGPNEFSIPPDAFVDGVARIKIVHTKAERGVQIVVTPLLAGLNQTSAAMNFTEGGITNFLVELTSATDPTPDQVYKLRVYEIVVSPRDRFLNVSNAQIQTKFTARFPGEFDNTLPNLSDIFSGEVFITGPTSYLVASRIARIKGVDELQWIRAYKSTDPSVSGQTSPYEVLDHAPNKFALIAPPDHEVIKLQLTSNQEEFSWVKAVPQDPYTDIVVSRQDARKYTDDVRYTIVYVDSISLTRAVKFESDDIGKLAKYTTTQGQLANLIETISGQKTQSEYHVVWFVEATDGLYKTFSSPPTDDPNQQPGYHLHIIKDGILGVANADVPKSFELGQNYPNPFNPTTTISFSLPVSTPVSLVVYDLLGTPVKTLVNEAKEAGTYRVTWDASNDLGQQVPSGNYIIKIVAGDFTQTRKMTLLK